MSRLVLNYVWLIGHNQSKLSDKQIFHREAVEIFVTCRPFSRAHFLNKHSFGSTIEMIGERTQAVKGVRLLIGQIDEYILKK